MTKFIALSAASAIALASSLSPLFAQTQQPQTGTTILEPSSEGSVTPDVAAPDAGTTASTSPASDAKAALAAINGTRDSSNQLGNIASVSKVNIVKLGELQGGTGPEIAAAMEANKDDTMGLQAAIMANPSLSGKIEEASVDVSSIVGTHVEADGSVTVYIQ